MDMTSNNSVISTQNLMGLGTPNDPKGGHSRGEDELQKAATQFETIFLKMFLDQARESKLSDDILGSSASDNFREMFDNEISKVGGEHFDLGLTDVIVRQLRTHKE